MVVGEMAPKSWAISHPERSAILLGTPVPRLHGVDPLGPDRCSTARQRPAPDLARSSRSTRPTSSRTGRAAAADRRRPGSTASSRKPSRSCSARPRPGGHPGVSATLPLAELVSVPAGRSGRRRRAAVAGERPLAPRGRRRVRRADRPRPRPRRRARPARHHRVGPRLRHDRARPRMPRWSRRSAGCATTGRSWRSSPTPTAGHRDHRPGGPARAGARRVRRRDRPPPSLSREGQPSWTAR